MNVGFTEQLANVLRSFASSRGRMVIQTRSRTGVDTPRLLEVEPKAAAQGVPPALVSVLLAHETARIAAFTRSGGTLIDLPVLIATWTLPTSVEPGGKRVVQPAANAVIAKALAKMTAFPNVFVAAGPEVWAGWRLERPIADVDEARAALQQLAERLDGEPPPADLGAWYVPLAGQVRNWNNGPPYEFITIFDVDPARQYAASQLLEAEGAIR